MKLVPLELVGVLAVENSVVSDSRGELIRTWNATLNSMGFGVIESSFSRNPKSRTLRGMHYQDGVHAENKFVLCLTGTAYDVVLDLRKDSPTYGEHLAFDIGTKSSFMGLIIPRGCAHGYLTLENETSLIYFMDTEFSPDNAKGIRWDDPKFQVKWPYQPEVISTRDLNWPNYCDQE